MNEKAKTSPPLGLLRKDLQIIPADTPSSALNSWMVFDPINDKYYKIYEKEYKIISSISEAFTFDDYLEYLNNTLRLNVTKEELEMIVSFMRSNGLMLPEYHIDEKRIEKMREMKKQAWFDIMMSAYLFFKVPVWHPDKFLNRTLDYVRFLFSKWVIWLCFLLALSGYILILMNWNTFISTIVSTFNATGFLRYIVVIVVIKIIHEMAHCYAAKYLGSRVRSVGIGIVFFMPRLYTDITDSWRITDGKKRAVIDAAGILSELFIGGIAAIVWANSSPGILNSTCYFLCSVSLINTIFINGNPFIRFDGYYLLSDLLAVENLQKQSTEAWNIFFDWIFLGIKISFESIINKYGKKYLFIYIFGISMFFYRIFLYTSIVLLVYFMFTKFLGILLAIAEIHLLFYRPIKNLIRRLIAVKKRNKLKFSRKTMIFFGIVLLILIIPLPWSRSLPCVTQSINTQYIYIPQSGYFKSSVEDSSIVNKGQVVAEFYSPNLQWALRTQKLLLEIAKVELDQMKSDPIKRDQIKSQDEKIQKIRSSVEEMQKQISLLRVKANFKGVFVLGDWNLQKGRWFKMGELFGVIEDLKSPEVIAYAEESEVRDIYPGDKVSIALNKDLTKYTGTVEYVDSVPLIEWNSSPLLDMFGGQIQVINTISDRFITKNRYYQIKIKTEGSIPLGRSGTANIRIYKSMGYSFIRNIVSPLQKEITF